MTSKDKLFSHNLPRMLFCTEQLDSPKDTMKDLFGCSFRLSSVYLLFCVSSLFSPCNDAQNKHTAVFYFEKTPQKVNLQVWLTDNNCTCNWFVGKMENTKIGLDRSERRNDYIVEIMCFLCLCVTWKIVFIAVLCIRAALPKQMIFMYLFILQAHLLHVSLQLFSCILLILLLWMSSPLFPD